MCIVVCVDHALEEFVPMKGSEGKSSGVAKEEVFRNQGISTCISIVGWSSVDNPLKCLAKISRLWKVTRSNFMGTSLLFEFMLFQISVNIFTKGMYNIFVIDKE